MQHALRGLAIANAQRQRERAMSAEHSSPRASEEFPPASSFSSPCAIVVGTVVLTPQSVERVSHRIKYVVENVGEKNGKNNVNFHVGNVDVTKLDSLMLVTEKDGERGGGLAASNPDKNPLSSTKNRESSGGGHKFYDPQCMCDALEVDWGVPVSPRDCVGMNAHLRSGFFGPEPRTLGGVGRENPSWVPRGAATNEACQEVEESEDGVEEVGWFVVDDELIDEAAAILSSGDETNMEEKLPIVSPTDRRSETIERKASFCTPDCICLSDMINVAGRRGKARSDGEKSYAAIDNEVFFPSPLSSRVIELLQEVKEGKRPTYRLCSSDNVYGTSQYIAKAGE